MVFISTSQLIITVEGCASETIEKVIKQAHKPIDYEKLAPKQCTEVRITCFLSQHPGTRSLNYNGIV